MNKIKKMVFLSFLVGMALVIYIIESQIPVLFPGIKLGLANTVSLTALILLGWKEALVVMFLRILLGSMFSGTMAAFLFSISGGILSNLVMIILYKYFRNYLSLSTISICGAIFHNIGQLLVASIIIQDFRIYIYLPVLLISAIITGYFIGWCTKFLTENLFKIPMFKDFKN
ncbi:Gx transporter family protein [Clostridium luticellarii]|jgi:heptaprenyl diphosphate synthase|uniref:Heptaprenyl diphosphate synthase component I n=1 Tax=Clostridium luticellarii TaxID=1691940 RepID=A0A2T0BRJ9_9CLOT|nr:Gx transporter family protein [Clostridium luticellarii]MCI1943782.1 Gx transporter family protein [Clostridium luticellarii]MCI1967043.1 Gx transporter family protein [Clostridium luticellarii]MCI1994410.1 Gx transporter family protein [Clostridium luticellarii]MCI2038637.1 Gx transporter family protein [Clostridium luticellarii]PRR86511.1 Heptaprenyl diphosphate synthase component I [Clostridium luticellarii]